MKSYVVINVRQWLCASDGDTALVLLLEYDVRGCLVDSNAEALQFVFNDSLIHQGLVHVEDDENKVTGFGHSNNLSTSTLTIFGTFNNTGKIENLNLSTVVHHLSGDSGKGRELVRRG